MQKNWIVKTASPDANKLIGGGFRSGEVHVIFSDTSGSVPALIASAIFDAQLQGLKTVYYDLSKKLSDSIIEANNLDLSGPVELVRFKLGKNAYQTTSHIIEHAKQAQCDLIVIDMSGEGRSLKPDFVARQAAEIEVDRFEFHATRFNWAVICILPIPSYKRKDDIIAAHMGKSSAMLMFRGEKDICVRLVEDQGHPCAVDWAAELSNCLIATGIYKLGKNLHYVLTDIPDNMKKHVLGTFSGYELDEYFIEHPESAQIIRKFIEEDAELSLNYALQHMKNGEVEEHYIEIARRVILFDGAAGDLSHASPNGAKAAVEIWDRFFEEAGLTVDFSHCSEEALMKIGRHAGLESAVSAALAGVPIDEIVF